MYAGELAILALHPYKHLKFQGYNSESFATWFIGFVIFFKLLCQYMPIKHKAFGLLLKDCLMCT